MTSNFKCPFCQKRLSQGYNHDRDTVIYHCNNCYFQGDGIIWIALIQAKQDLEILKEALRVVNNQYRLVKPRGFSPRGDMATLCAMGEIAEKALEQIEHKE